MRMRVSQPRLDGARKGMRRTVLPALSPHTQDLSFEMGLDALFDWPIETMQPKGATS